MKKQKIKLGARILSTEELNAILPNAESVYEQITVFRNSIPDEDSRQSGEYREIEQKTNNIGIMGCRGTGKTSILKTFYHNLKGDVNDVRKDENEQKDKNYRRDGDIILPIIIPENMSPGTTLMDAVLGRLRSVVEEREELEEKDKYLRDCIYSGRASLEQQYNELVKQYCYIKKDYRDILIQQFTTEQNYVDKTKKVFSSDSEFINLFNKFVTELLQRGKRADRKAADEENMIFLFIDDVDLSTDRCMDIVRTLLVYLSNPRIVTFISGDLETFEEALTLEFLRQEEALRKDVFRETYYAVNGNSDRTGLLERKKILAYEYLRKIIPPAYRRAIRDWSLEERGNYQIADTDGSKQKTLAELLMEVSKEKLKKQYFIYREGEKQKIMGLAFHMFDHTSRGLNNVYNVLQEVSDAIAYEKDMTEEREKLLFWRLIETMVDSRPLYARFKSQLLKQVIILGQEQVKVDFSNAYRLLYKEKHVFTAEKRFSIYFLIDFVARLFSQEPCEENDGLKNRIVQEYLSDEEIDGRIASERELIECLVSKEDKALQENKALQKDKTLREGSVQQILVKFLRECDFILVLHLIRYLERTRIYDILTDKNMTSEQEAAYRIAYALYRAVQAVSESEEGIKNELADLYVQMRDTMLNLLSKLSLNAWNIYGRQLTGNISIVTGMRYTSGIVSNLAEALFWNVECYITECKADSTLNGCWFLAEYENRNLLYWIYYENKLRERQQGRIDFNIQKIAEETIRSGITTTIMNQLSEWKAIDRYEVKAMREVSYDGLSEGKDKKEKKEILVIEQIDKQGLWDSLYVKDTVRRYLSRKRSNYVFKMGCGRAIFDATLLVTTGAFAELEKCDKGLSGKALVWDLEFKLKRVMFLPVNENWQRDSIFSGEKYYLRLEQVLIVQCLLEEFLHIHWRVRYGKREARRLLMEVKELPLVIHTSDRDAIDAQLWDREEKFLSGEITQPGAKQDYISEIAEPLRVKWYDDSNNHGNMRALVKENLGEKAEENYMYYLYLMQKSEIERRKKIWQEELNDNKKEEIDWSRIEPDASEKEYIFFFHSYLRYLQVNDSDAKKAGARAEDIARLAQYMLDSEMKADERIQNEVYQLISKEIELTEEEFESLF